MDFLFSPGSPLFDFLSPFQLLKMLHLSRSARRGAVPKLKKFQASVQTAGQALMFEQWLENPTAGSMGAKMQRSNSRKNLAGPLRLGSIQQHIDTLRERFIILNHEKKHAQESSSVAVFDDEGSFVAYYNMTSCQFYESYCNKSAVDAQDLQWSPDLRIECSAFFHVGDHSDRWEINTQDLDWAEQTFIGNIIYPNYALFKNFHGTLSPTEVAAVLMHALSSDTRVIYWYVSTLFATMNVELLGFLVREEHLYEEEEFEALKALRRSLPGV